MKELQPFDYVPAHQPFEGEEVSFRLKSMNQGDTWDLEASFNKRGHPTKEGLPIVLQHIDGWKGEGLGEFSRTKLASLLIGKPDSNWRIWLHGIAGKLYARALLEDDLAKKS